jgi:hypothetical protein
MSRTKELIAGVLRDIAEEASDPRSLAEVAWQAGRRRRLIRMVSSAVALTAAVAIAVVVLPDIASNARPVPANSQVVSIPLRSPLELRQVASATSGQRCSHTAVTIPGSGSTGELCLYLASVGMNVTAVQSAYIQDDPLPRTNFSAFFVILRLAPSGMAQLQALTRDIYRQPRPHDVLAEIVQGHFVGVSVFDRPYTQDIYSIFCDSRAAAESLLNQLLHG